jgi:hypothetical protein
MPVTRKVPPRPPASVPVIDLKTGLITEAWYQYFTALDAFLREAAPLIP